MYYFTNILASLALVVYFNLVVASPSTSLLQSRVNTKGVCGTTADATLSDCRKLIEIMHPAQIKLDWNRDRQCEVYTTPYWAPACYGECCIWTSDRLADHSIIKHWIEALMGCRSESNNSINGRIWDDDRKKSWCIGDSKHSTCRDCFED